MEGEPQQGSIRPGPGKQPRRGPPQPAYTTHKRRAVWFQARADAGVEADIDNLVSERARMKGAPGLDWDFVGPSNIGGRASSLAVHPTEPDVVYLGAAGGGVWMSHDAGQHWKPLWHFEDVLSIGSLAIDPQNPDVLYAATGEANLTGDNYPGVGIYRSADQGLSWDLLASCKDSGIPQRIGAMAIDPANTQHLVIGGVSFTGEKPGGMFSSTDGGQTWRREVAFAAGNYRCHSIVFHPAGGILYAAIDASGVNSGIWRSTDNGGTWIPLREGLPPGDAFGRASLAICRSHPEHLYALAADRKSLVLGVFRTINGGEIWSAVGWEYFGREEQVSYNNCIAVHPDDHDFVICGGVDLHRTTDGGKTWTQATEWTATRNNGGYAHADHHAVVIPTTAPNYIYDANDGGMDFSMDGGITWVNRSDTLGATMFYAMDVAQSDGNHYGGGTQDNGSVVTDSGRADRFFQVLGGDGGWMVYDPTDPTHLYASYDHMHIYRHRASDGWIDVTPDDATPSERGAVWMAEIVMDPSCPTTVFTASQRIWRTRNDGESWTPVSPVLDSSVVTALEVCKSNPRILYAGTHNGGVFKSSDAGNSWSQNLAGALLPGKVVTGIKASPISPDVVFACVAGVDLSRPYPHVYRSLDGGKTWEDADHGQLPNVPHHSLAFQDTAPPYALFVASDAGVFQSPDLANTWTNISGNLPHVMVTDLAYHTKDSTLTAATYGRGLWRLRIG